MIEQEKLRTIIRNIIIAISTIILARLSYLLVFDQVQYLFPMYLPSGLTFFFLYHKPKSNIIGIYIGTFLEAMWTLITPLQTNFLPTFFALILISIGNSLQPVVSTYITEKYEFKQRINAKFEENNNVQLKSNKMSSSNNKNLAFSHDMFSNLKSFNIFMLGIIIGCLIAGLIGSISLQIINGTYNSPKLYDLFNWTISDIAAIGLIFPIPYFLNSINKENRFEQPTNYREMILFLFISLSFQIWALAGFGFKSYYRQFDYLVLPFIIYAGFRFNPKISVLHVLSISLFKIIGIILHMDITEFTVIEEIALSQFFVIIVAFTNLFLIIVVHERLQSQQQLKEYSEKLEEKVEKSLSKIKVLKGFLPICSECKKIQDTEGNWFRLEEFIDSHSEAKLSHGYCPECSKKILNDFEKQIN
jgi:integral membrane sensor domain MASE1